MGTVYAFFADGFEEIEAFTAIDTLRRGGLNVEIVSVTPDEIVVGAHDVSVLCDINFDNCDFFDAELLLLPGGMPGAATLDKHEGLRRLILDFAAKNKPIAAICAAPMVLGKLGLLKGRRRLAILASSNIWKVPNVSMLRLFVTEISLRVWDRALPWNLL